MEVEGSMGTPSFKQIIMQKQRKNVRGVRVTGYDGFKKPGGTNKKKKQAKGNDQDSNTEDRGAEDDRPGNTKNKATTGQKMTDNKGKKAEEERENADNRQENKGMKGDTSSSHKKHSPTNEICKPIKTDNLRVFITDVEIQAYREHMTEHAVICKLMGMWPTERALCQRIRHQWKPKGDVRLHLGAKGFFTVVFTNLEDKDGIFDGGPYFMASAGLYMRPWKENFTPKKESFTQVPVWIRLFSLPIDYWGSNSLKKIGDRLGTFIKASEATLQKKYTSCVRICVEMDVSGALHEGLWLEYRDEDYFQRIDYEQIPFRCRKCHEHGHLIRECPMNKKEEDTKTEQGNKAKDNFITPKSRQRANRRRIKNRFAEEGNKNISEVQMQERPKEQEEDTDMLTSDGGSEDLELEEVLAREGMNLPGIAEKWKTQGIENAPEEEIRKINDMFIARQKAELESRIGSHV
eukprot:PITA_12372